MNKYLYMPIESKVRELDSKLLVAIELIKNDFVVLIGSKSMISEMGKLPKGIFFYKDSSSPMESKFKSMKEYGHIICVHDEEGFVQMSWSDYIRTRIKFNTLSYVDKYFCWGSVQLNAIKKVKKDLKHTFDLLDVGHPRIDLLRAPIREYNKVKIGKGTILINTKLAEFNHNGGEDRWMDIMKKHDMLKDESFIKLKQDQVLYKKKLMKSYIDLIQELSKKFMNYEIVLRPHPSENLQTWLDITENFKNVIVTHEKPIGYWIHQSDIVIHTGCTTAIEAFIMDKPVIAFKPINDKRFDVPLPDSISFKVKNIADCAKMVKRCIGNDYDFFEYKRKGNEILSNSVSSLDGEFSYEKIIKELKAIDVNKVKFNTYQKNKIKLIFLYLNFKKLLKPTSSKYNRTISKVEVKDSLDRLQQVTKSSEKITICTLADNLYMLYVK
jgi:surface carbohydrate biosynthesis protein